MEEKNVALKTCRLWVERDREAAEGGLIKLAAKPPPQPSGPKAPSNLRTFRPPGRSILRTFSHHAEPFEPFPLIMYNKAIIARS